MSGVVGIANFGSASMRAGLLAALAAFQVGCCALLGRELTESHGSRPESSAVDGARSDHDAKSPLLVEVIVDGADDLLFERILVDKIAAALSRYPRFKVVREDADLVFRVIVSDDDEPGFEKQGPVLVKVLVVDREDDSPARLCRLEMKAIVFGHFSCLKKQAFEVCECFVTYLDVVTRMASEMKEDAK
jgi:hypothetical protein